MTGCPKQGRIDDPDARAKVREIPWCEWCGKSWGRLDVAHIRPCKMGGGSRMDTLGNMVRLCLDCHDKLDVRLMGGPQEAARRLLEAKAAMPWRFDRLII